MQEETKTTEVDMVNNPPHYTTHPSGIECIWLNHHAGFALGNAIKYLYRHGLKGAQLKDLQKALWYVDFELKRFSLELDTESSIIAKFERNLATLSAGALNDIVKQVILKQVYAAWSILAAGSKLPASADVQGLANKVGETIGVASKQIIKWLFVTKFDQLNTKALTAKYLVMSEDLLGPIQSAQACLMRAAAVVHEDVDGGQDEVGQLMEFVSMLIIARKLIASAIKEIEEPTECKTTA